MTETNVNEIFRKLKELTGSGVEEVHDPLPPGDRKRSCLSHEKIKKEFGWEPDYDLDYGLKETVEGFRKKK